MFPHQRLTPGQLNIFDPETAVNSRKFYDLVISQKLFLSQIRLTRLRHTINTAQITAVCDRNADIVDIAAVLI